MTNFIENRDYVDNPVGIILNTFPVICRTQQRIPKVAILILIKGNRALYHQKNRERVVITAQQIGIINVEK